jgi:hypothetical protein
MMNKPTDTRRFSVDGIPEMTRQLSPIHRKVLEQVWNHFLTSGAPFPVLSMQVIIGKQAIADALSGLSGSLLFENENDRSFSLKIYGALLTSNGPVLATLLFRLLDWLKKLCEKDLDLKSLDSTTICAGLQLSEADSTQLACLLKLGPPGMPFWLSNQGPKTTDPWAITITHEITDLYRCDDVLQYLNDRLSAGYDPDEPYAWEARSRRSVAKMFAAQSMFEAPPSVTDVKQMKILISWSGDLSHQIALAMREWIGGVLPSVDPWVSSKDIPKGHRWGADLAKQLETTNCGIVCLVPTNIDEPWLNFESGALSKTVEQAQVHPFLVGMSPGDLKDSPLSQFQATQFNKDEVKDLVRAINTAGGAPVVPADQVERTFQVSWVHLEQKLRPLEAKAIAEITAKGSKLPQNVTQAVELSEEEVKALSAMADMRGTIDPKVLGIALHIREQRAQYILERLDSLDLVYLVSGPMGTAWHLSPDGRTELVKRNLL